MHSLIELAGDPIQPLDDRRVLGGAGDSLRRLDPRSQGFGS